MERALRSEGLSVNRHEWTRWVALGFLGTLVACGSGAGAPAPGTDAGAHFFAQLDAGAPDALPDAVAWDGGWDGALDEAGLDAADCAGPGSRFVTGVVDHSFGPGQSQGQDQFPSIVFGPPHGGGCCKGSLDTVSLGNGGSVTVEFAGNAIVDGPGPDFIVFENAFFAGGNADQVFAELGTVEVSADGQSWTAFPCTALAPPYGSCAGWHPVYANPDTNNIDPLDPAQAGGDAFDLADIGVSYARYVRITDRPDQTGFNGVFDLDAVGIVNARCP
jgi:hypothetical protein